MSSEQRPIEIIREYRKYYFENPCVIRIETKLTVSLPIGNEFYIYPIRGNLADLEVKLDGTQMPILHAQELEKITGFIIDLDFIKKGVSSISGISVEELIDIKNYFFIKFPKIIEDKYSEILITWNEQIEGKRKTNDLLSEISFYSMIFPPTGRSSLYVSFIVADKYELVGETLVYKIETINYGLNNDMKATSAITLVENEGFSNVLDDSKHHVVRFERNGSNKIGIKYTIGIPVLIRTWLWLGFFFGIGTIPYGILNYQTHIQFVETLLAGVVALLIGFRILLFHDIELLRRWNVTYIILIVANIILLTILGAPEMIQNLVTMFIYA